MQKYLSIIFFIIINLNYSQNQIDLSIKTNLYSGLFSKNDVPESTYLIYEPRYNNSNHSELNIFIPPNDSSKTETETFSTFELIEQLKKLDDESVLNVVHNPTIERYIRVFLKDRRESLSKVIDRSAYYFPMIEQILDQYDLPIELKYLAVVESGLKPFSNSRVGAKGLWQFMYGTGKDYNLIVDSYIDERLDPLKSTDAACRYLTYLFNRFQDWDLALAAYNAGPGNVSKAIKRANNSKNYWEIRSFLPQETRGYLPAFYASYYILENAEIHHLSAEKTSITKIKTDSIQVQSTLNINHVAKKLNMDSDLLLSINPQYKKGIIPNSKTVSYSLVLPKNKIDSFIEIEEELYQQSTLTPSNSGAVQITTNNSYEVKSGDNLYSIAKKFGITLEQLKKLNGLQTNFLIPHQRLVVKNDKAQYFKTNQPVSETKNDQYIYTVRKGDSLFMISKKFKNTTVEQIKTWNQLEGKKYLQPGMKLIIHKS